MKQTELCLAHNKNFKSFQLDSNQKSISLCVEIAEWRFYSMFMELLLLIIFEIISFEIISKVTYALVL